MYMPEGRGGSLPFPGMAASSCVSALSRLMLVCMHAGTKQSLQAARGYLVCVYEFSRDGALDKASGNGSAGGACGLTLCAAHRLKV